MVDGGWGEKVGGFSMRRVGKQRRGGERGVGAYGRGERGDAFAGMLNKLGGKGRFRAREGGARDLAWCPFTVFGMWKV